MIKQPVLENPQLRLRPLKRSDASAIQKAASAQKIADTMISLPHPYPEGEAARYRLGAFAGGTELLAEG